LIEEEIIKIAFLSKALTTLGRLMHNCKEVTSTISTLTTSDIGKDQLNEKGMAILSRLT
jgi:hypothetical protein